MVAAEKGRLAELSQALEEIKQRKGLKEGEYWPIGEGPTDYKSLISEYEGKSKSQEETVFLVLLHRYHFDYVITLYEQDRATFEVMVEVGRRLDFPDAEMAQLHDERIRREYGDAAFELLQQRLRIGRSIKPVGGG